MHLINIVLCLLTALSMWELINVTSAILSQLSKHYTGCGIHEITQWDSRVLILFTWFYFCDAVTVLVLQNGIFCVNESFIRSIGGISFVCLFSLYINFIVNNIRFYFTFERKGMLYIYLNNCVMPLVLP